MSVFPCATLTLFVMASLATWTIRSSCHNPERIVGDGHGVWKTEGGQEPFDTEVTKPCFKSESLKLSNVQIKNQAFLSGSQSLTWCIKFHQEISCVARFSRRLGIIFLNLSKKWKFLDRSQHGFFLAKTVPSKCQCSPDTSELNYVPVLQSCLMPCVPLQSASCQEPSCQVARCQAACCHAYRCQVPAPSVPDWSCKLLGYPS